MPKLVDIPFSIRAYLYHGVDLQWEGRSQVATDCPFCQGARKFTVKVETGEARCFTCDLDPRSPKGGINGISFIRRLWEESRRNLTGLGKLAHNRGLLYQETLVQWGVCRSIIDDEWLVPAWTIEGRFYQLYRWGKVAIGTERERRVLQPTPGIWPDGSVHGLFGVPPLKGEGREHLYIAEGAWDAMVLWETLGICRQTESSGLILTSNEDMSELSKSIVVATPGCNVFSTKWVPLGSGREVVILFDNDYPKKDQRNGSIREPSAWAGARRVSQLISYAVPPPKEIKVLRWGGERDSHSTELKDGCDLRDYLSSEDEASERVTALWNILEMVHPIPKDWVGDKVRDSEGKPILMPLECNNWKTVLEAWEKAFRMRQDIRDALAVMLAVCLSTDQRDDQLFLMVLGVAGSGKTQLCQGLLVSRKCYPLKHLKGFHSGYKDKSGKNFSLILKINHLTLVTPEGDVIVSSPDFVSIMSQQREIFDGTSGASYKNQAEDTNLSGLRTPWIMAGTFALLDTDQSQLGDRFIRVCIESPTEEEKGKILLTAGLSMLDSVVQSSNCQPESQGAAEMIKAKRLTGGYVNWLRETPDELLKEVRDRLREEKKELEVVGYCANLADFTAYMRARPGGDRFRDKEHDATKELPTRLQKQFVRLAMCLAVVLNKKSVDDEVKRLVRKVALDTSRGKSLEIAMGLVKEGSEKGVSSYRVGMWVGWGQDKAGTFLRFLKQIGVVEAFTLSYPGAPSGTRWRLTSQLTTLYNEISG